MKHGGGSILIWGCITRNGVGPVYRIEGTMKKEDYLNILQTNLPQAIRKSGMPEEEVIFQHDGDPKHTAKIVKEWLGTQTFSMLTWPAQSPDISPIENLWAYVKRKLAGYAEPPKGLNELWNRFQEEWSKIPQEIIDNLYLSMPNRISELQKNKGFWINY